MDMRDLKIMIQTLENLNITNTGLVIECAGGELLDAEAKAIKDTKGFYKIAFVAVGDKND